MRNGLIVLSIFVSDLAYYSTKVEVDASAETLLLDDDKDLKFFREVNKRYNNLNFLVVTFTPHNDLLSNQSLETIKNLSKEFLSVENISSNNLPFTYGNSANCSSRFLNRFSLGVFNT